MIPTITFNPAVDQTMRFDEPLATETVNRSTASRFDAGGKGINVSQFLTALRMETVASGIVGGFTGQFLREALHDDGVETDFVEVEAPTRLNSTVIAAGTEYKLNQHGPDVASSVVEDIVDRIAARDPDRAMVGGGRSDSLFGGGRSETTRVTSDDLVSERATANPEGEGQLASPPEDVSGGARDPVAGGLDETGTFRGSLTRQQDDAFGGTGKPGTAYGEPSDRDFSAAVDRMFHRRDEPTDTGPGARREAAARRSVEDEAATPEGEGFLAPTVGATAGGLLGSARGLARTTQSGGLFGAEATADSTARVGADLAVRPRTDARQDTEALVDERAGLDLRSDVGVRSDVATGQRFDAGFDLRQDVRQDLRQDVREGIRQDVRQDVRQDIRQDTRVDTRVDLNRDRRRDDAFGLDPNRGGQDAAAGMTGEQGRYEYETPSLF